MNFSKLNEILRTTSDYVLGVGKNEFYNYTERFADSFFPPTEADRYISSLKKSKRNKILSRNMVNLGEAILIATSILGGPNYLMVLGGLGVGELMRNLDYKDCLKQEKIIAQSRKEILQQEIKYTPQGLDELTQLYEENNRGEEWKNQ